MQLLRSVRFENNRGKCSSSKLHPHPCLLRRALTAAMSAMVAAETSAPTTAHLTAKTCTKCGKHGHFTAVCRQQSTSGTRHGQRRSRMSPQKENDNEIICNLRDFELEHCIYDPSHDTWVKKSSAPQPTLGIYATHYPCDTRALGLQTPLRRPTKAALVSVAADTGCQSCLAGTNLLFKLGLNVRHLSKTRLQMTAANGNNLDIIGAIALRLSDSTSQGGIETRQIVYICRDTSDFFLSRGACVELGIVPPDFPNGCQKRQSTAEVSACNVTSESLMTATCDCPRRQPPPLPPKDLPFPAV